MVLWPSLALARRRLATANAYSSPPQWHRTGGTAAFRGLPSTAARTDDVLVWNSLSGTCEPLPRGDAVTPHVLRWYACGPTVYDRAHLGHARAYVSQDILRRVLEKRFQHNVFLVMGVTDVDDKIIQRARERGVAFDALARDEEREFFRDMEALHVLPPSAVTRVSEHMDDIVQYVATIERNGFAYAAADGSGVYFNTTQLGDAYGKLDPMRLKEATRSDVDADADDAAPVDNHHDDSVKLDKRDFALWKATKDAEHEPWWDSPWGKGRPGWHIECSAMIHRVLGERLDVHSGGVDLKFPHHNNEIAQCEAHNCSHHADVDWCRHFIHFGHLYIRGLKMSKSLKNFVSIKDFLASNGQNAADQFRIFCLQYKYRVSIHYSEDRMRDAVVVTDRIRNFLRNIDAYGTQVASASESQRKRCEPHDLAILSLLFDTRVAFDAALRDDFDTPTALAHVLELVRRVNEYLLRHGRDSPSEVLWTVSSFVLDVLDVFGLENMLREFGYLRDALKTSAFSAHDSSASTSSLAGSDLAPHKVLQSLVEFRAAVRKHALLDPSTASNARILNLCDALRDDELPTLGVQLEDLDLGRSVFKLLMPHEREAFEEAKVAEAEAMKLKNEALAAKQQEFEALMQISPDQLFRQHSEFAGKYGQFDEHGVPTHDVDSNMPLTKSQRKKLLKRLEKHTKSYSKYWADRANP